MSTTVSFAGNLTDDPELAETRGGGKPYVTFRVMVNHRFQSAQGEWQAEEPTPLDVRVYGGAATNVADSFGSGDGVTVHGRLKTEAWTDKATGEKRTSGSSRSTTTSASSVAGSTGGRPCGPSRRIGPPRRRSRSERR